MTKKWPLILIIVLASFMRFFQIGHVPPSLYWDEVSQGYNSYSILATGRDEHQELLPLARFQAFGDYKAPVYIYLDVPFLAVFGKNDLSVRMPSLIFGTLTVLLAFFLARELFYKNEKREVIALLTAVFLAISPWHIQLSRVAYEANIATFFTVLGITIFLFALRRKLYLLPLSTISFVLGFYSFNAHRVFIPLLVISLLLLFRKELLTYKKYVITSALTALLLLLPFFFYIIKPESRLRFQEVNIFSDIKVIEDSNALSRADHNSPIGKIVHNRRVLYGVSYLKHYFDFFDPTYLFFTGDQNPRFSDQEDGELYLWMVIGIIAGFYTLLTRRSKSTWIILIWFLLAPVAGATARETPHALRSETFIPLYELIAALGFVSLFVLIPQKMKRIQYAVLGSFVLIIFLSLVRFFHNYLIDSSRIYSQDWQYGYKEAVIKVQAIEKKYEKIYFTNAYGRSYIYVAWYGNILPQEFWKTVSMKKDAFGFYNVDRLGKYIFTNPPARLDSTSLVVTPPYFIPKGNKVIDHVSFLDGSTAFVFSVAQ